ncbi:MAG TPA: type II toxin-antitoxin system PemK/MazF family toxin [Pirellulales bacterium]|nr:type II toxin-antitoxin system PemK/MazF family toxin [Pirellulales bacterium]
MKARRGDVVIVDYPYSDASGSRVRPALVVQGDLNNTRLTSTIVAMITKNIQFAATEPAHLLINIDSPDGKRSGLHVTSAVSFNNLFTVHEQLVLKTIGRLPPPLMLQVDECLKAALGIA